VLEGSKLLNKRFFSKGNFVVPVLYCKEISVWICHHLAFDADAQSQKRSSKNYFSKAI